MKNLVFKLVIIFLFFTASCSSDCDKICIAEQYYQILNNPDYNKASVLISDSLLTTEGDYRKTFSNKNYIELLKWDAVFKPEYKVLKIKKEGETVKTTVSQTSKRILFLHGTPVIYNQIFKFKGDRISSVETPDYVVFNDSVFISNREKLLIWVRKNHPEINDFIYDQTEIGGLNYLKAINLYNHAH